MFKKTVFVCVDLKLKTKKSVRLFIEAKCKKNGIKCCTSCSFILMPTVKLSSVIKQQRSY